MKRTNKGGSILSFILVAIGFALLLMGGLYLVRQQFLRQQIAPVTAPAVTPQAGPSKKPIGTVPSQQTANVPQKAQPTTDPSSSSIQAHPSGASALPHTGPVETLGASIGVGCLSWSLVAYIRSRRAALPPILT